MLYLAEFYLPGGTSLDCVAARARAGAEQAARAGAQVSFVAAIFVPQDECCYALYRAGAAAEVTAAGSLAGLAFDRVAPAVVSGGMPPQRPPPTGKRPSPTREHPSPAGKRLPPAGKRPPPAVRRRTS